MSYACKPEVAIVAKVHLRLRFNPPYDLSGLPILKCAVLMKANHRLPFLSL